MEYKNNKSTPSDILSIKLSQIEDKNLLQKFSLVSELVPHLLEILRLDKKIWIAGGFIRFLIRERNSDTESFKKNLALFFSERESDIDLFTETSESFENLKSYFEQKFYLATDSGFAETYAYKNRYTPMPNIKFQLIKKLHKSPQNLLLSFDFINTMAAANQDTLVFHKQIFQLEDSKTLSLYNFNNPLFFAYRMCKYIIKHDYSSMSDLDINKVILYCSKIKKQLALSQEKFNKEKNVENNNQLDYYKCVMNNTKKFLYHVMTYNESIFSIKRLLQFSLFFDKDKDFKVQNFRLGKRAPNLSINSKIQNELIDVKDQSKIPVIPSLNLLYQTLTVSAVEGITTKQNILAKIESLQSELNNILPENSRVKTEALDYLKDYSKSKLKSRLPEKETIRSNSKISNQDLYFI